MKHTTITLTLLGIAAIGIIGPLEAQAPNALVTKFRFDVADDLSAWHEISNNDQTPSIVVLDTTQPHSGASALKFQITKDSTGARYIFTGVKLAANDQTKKRRIRIRFFARTNKTVSGDIVIGALQRNATKVTGWLDNKTSIVSIGPAASWTEYTAEGALGDDTTMLTLEITMAHPKAGQTVWIDDLSLEQIPGTAK